MRFLLFLLCLQAAPARAAIELEAKSFVDETASLSAEEVAARPEEEWRPVDVRKASFGQTSARVWLRFRLNSGGPKFGPNEPLLLEVANGFNGRLSLYSLVGGKAFELGSTGLEVPVSKRSVLVLRTGFPVFRISGPRDPNEEFLISSQGSLPISIPLGVWEAPEFPFHHWVTMFLVGVFAGSLFIAALSNAFLAFSLRSRLYATYSLFAVTMLFIFLFATGLTMQLFWPEATWWAQREMYVYSAFALLFYAWFAREFLSTRQRFPWLDRAVVACVVISAARSVWMLFNINETIAISGELASATCNFLFLAIAIKSLRSGERAARYFFFASLSFNVAMVVFLLQEVNLIYISPLVFWAPFMGTLIEINLLGLALADRIRSTRRELSQQKAATVQADKLGALGRMAGEIAHEISNPLAVIHGNAAMLRGLIEQGKGSPEEIAPLAQTIEATTMRISKIVKGMRSLARDTRIDPLNSTPVSVVLQDALAVCQERIRGCGARVETQAFSDELAISCRASEISQVLVNLLNNALDAVDGRDASWIRIEVQQKKNQVELSVTDSGPGIPARIRSQIHEPFFTTKEAGKGLGLGLSISRTIIEEGHGGKIWLDESSENTRFVFSVPLSK